MISDKFDFLVNKLSHGTISNKLNKIYLTNADVNYLSKFEKQALSVIAKLRGILTNPDIDFNYEDLMKTLGALVQGKGDSERAYLLSIFFPEKVKTAQPLLPFPIPCATYCQNFPIYVTPNDLGCFLIQFSCPTLLDASYSTSASNIWVNINAGLDGQNLLNASTFTPIIGQRPPAGAFTSYILQAAKLSCRYIGRFDIISGIFGASQHISVANSLSPDPATTQFQYVDDSLNSSRVYTSETLNVIYYPADYSYNTFQKLNTDHIATGGMTTNMRLNIYGQGLPAGNVSAPIIIDVHLIYNIIPTPLFSDILPTSKASMVDELDILQISSDVAKTGLTTFTGTDSWDVERFATLPKPLRERAIKEFEFTDKGMFVNKNILDMLRTLIGERNNNKIVITKDLIDAFVSEKEKNILEDDKREENVIFLDKDEQVKAKIGDGQFTAKDTIEYTLPKRSKSPTKRIYSQRLDTSYKPKKKESETREMPQEPDVELFTAKDKLDFVKPKKRTRGGSPDFGRESEAKMSMQNFEFEPIVKNRKDLDQQTFDMQVILPKNKKVDDAFEEKVINPERDFDRFKPEQPKVKLTLGDEAIIE